LSEKVFEVPRRRSRVAQLSTLGILAPPFMKSKQLANVLIKMLGLSVCLYAIPSCITGILYGLTTMMASKPDIIFMRVFSSSVGEAVQAIIGIVIICQSQKIAGMMFKADDE
jgi:hypothetical protein